MWNRKAGGSEIIGMKPDLARFGGGEGSFNGEFGMWNVE